MAFAMFLILGAASVSVLAAIVVVLGVNGVRSVAPGHPGDPPRPADGRLLQDLRSLTGTGDARVSVIVVDLSQAQPQRIAIDPDAVFDAGSTYKLPVLMANGERIAAGRMKPTDRLCFRPEEAEQGWFDDYEAGDCFSRQTLSMRAATYSDNTAGRILVDDLGGAAALNSYAQGRGAQSSAFFSPNRTTASDLAALWTAEALGQAGGAGAQRWLYPMLTKTAFEHGLPAGVPSSASVVHKVGAIGGTVIDAGLAIGPRTRYVAVVAEEGLAGDAGWGLVARVSGLIWKYEAGAQTVRR